MRAADRYPATALLPGALVLPACGEATTLPMQVDGATRFVRDLARFDAN